VGPTTRGKGPTLMVLADGQGPPLGVCVEAASPSEVKRLARTLDRVQVPRRRGARRRPQTPERRMADRGDGSNPARALVVTRAIGPIIPQRRHNRKAPPQDGRQLRRDQRRWMIERTPAWRQPCRRLVARDARQVKNFEARVPLACA
jgi:hypothetical protein